MVPVALATIGTGARRPTILYLGWFGPRGLASIVFAVILVEEAELPHTQTILVAIFATIALSVYAHGLTAQPLTDRYAGWFRAHPPEAQPVMESVPTPEQRWRRPTWLDSR
jgi:NhaP-type Na+/H+ or K+/H+ antiporter